jgi:hypothetical protein
MNLELCNNHDDFRRQIAELDEGGLQGNLLMQHGALNAIRFLLSNGSGGDAARKMEDDIEAGIGVIEQVCAERGFSLDIVHAAFGLKSKSTNYHPAKN